MTGNADKLACVLIAAGNSSRLGQSKQLVELENQTLLNRAIKLAHSATQEIHLVLGSDALTHRQSLNDSSLEVLENRDWQIGMGSSIAAGVSSLSDDVDGVLILLCDQWQLNAEDIKQLKDIWFQSPHKFVCSQYREQRTGEKVFGAPAIFPRQYFDKLKTLRETGARKILNKYPRDRLSVEIPNAGIDLDTIEDLNRMKQYNSN